VTTRVGDPASGAYPAGVLILHFDYPSPASAVALLRLQRVADAGGHVAFAGLDALGLASAVPPTLDQLVERERVAVQAAQLGLPLGRPSRRPPTLLAHLLGDLAEDEGRGTVWREACLRAYWTQDADLGDRDLLRSLAGGTGLDPAAVEEALRDPRRQLARRQQDLAVRRRGVGAVPVLELDGTFVPADLEDAALHELAAL
jgi:2-hydroxychromene-2-carboxylate isomerase